MIERYTRPEMGRIWLEVELAAAEALTEMGCVPVTAERVVEIEGQVKPLPSRPQSPRAFTTPAGKAEFELSVY